MKRREFVRFLGAVAASACPLVARAQQPGATRRLGILMSVQDDAEGKVQLSGFTQALAGLGWIEGRNLQTQFVGAVATPGSHRCMRKNWLA